MSQPADTKPDETMARIVAAVELGRSGQRGEARDALTALWDRIGADGDAFHRCVLAHYLADLQDSAEAELVWDERALAAVADLTDDRAQRYHSSLQVQGFLPSLHLNLADVHRRLGNADLARQHLANARDLVQHLPEDPYGTMVRAGIRNVTGALDAGSTHRLDSHP
ncbi:hypothetical protein [Microbispora sp. ATCC PTA-5024]|uniref:hypothetical protein n=1 Tax=Microbispora sp. ATCC PTA-5024 TaxID=316330 RepID=UPI0003DD1B09|nr:hypothetical protein [Microbispora sp. ATCC PTA-5024]ETK32923.1 hypothetical protein MPTA5024_27340 [Microbispora sp. ATCC PTA-5024]